MEQSGYFATAEQHLYGTFFLPEGKIRKGMLILAPFGEEKKCAFRLLVRLARALLKKDIATFMFDLGGTGESTGDHATATWQQWQTEANMALELLRKKAGTVDLWILGARLGGPLAAAVAPPATKGIVLLEPVISGEDFLRDLDRRRQIKDMVARKEDDAQKLSTEERWEQNLTVDFGGFEVNAKLAEEIHSLVLSELLTHIPSTCAIHLVRVSGSKSFPPPWETLVEKAKRSPNGSAIIVRDKPFWGQLEYYESTYVIDQVVNCVTKKQAEPEA